MIKKSVFLLLVLFVSKASFSQSFDELRELKKNGNAASSSQNLNKGFDSAISSVIGSQDSVGLASQSDYVDSARQGILLPGEVDIRQLLPKVSETFSPPYGANIFAGGYETERADGLNENYLVAAGDKISIWLWGAISFSNVLTVDNQGNIFIPNIGPIRVSNTSASNLNSFVASKVKAIYKKNVQIYVNLLTTTPVSVFISGSVIRPGQYAGMASDSVLYFLKRAGGIDSERGSYREIKLLRDNEVIHIFDLYSFIRDGKLSNISFKDNDVIFVSEQKSMFNVAGKVRNPFRFEFVSDTVLGKELLPYVKPLTNTSHVAIMGNRNNEPYSIYLPLQEFKTYQLRDGDKLVFNEDLHAQVYDIEILGSHLGPSYYAVKKSTTLHELLSHVEIDKSLADFSSIYILRESVRLQQKEILNKSLDRLERSIYFSPSNSSGEASIRAQEAKLVSEFVARARLVEPLGKVVVSDNGLVSNITLEQGDKIVIPTKSDLIQVGGEVLLPQAVVYNKDADVEDYIAWAGGYTERADFENLVIIHASGLSKFIHMDENWFGNSNDLNLAGGDKILILPKVEAKTMQTVKDFTQILYQIAVTANALN